MNVAFFKYAAASLVAASAVASSCNEELPTPVAQAPVEEEIELMGDVEEFDEIIDIPVTGLVAWPDSTEIDIEDKNINSIKKEH
jgi:hypothetical protein